MRAINLKAGVNSEYRSEWQECAGSTGRGIFMPLMLVRGRSHVGLQRMRHSAAPKLIKDKAALCRLYSGDWAQITRTLQGRSRSQSSVPTNMKSYFQGRRRAGCFITLIFPSIPERSRLERTEIEEGVYRRYCKGQQSLRRG